MLLGCRLVPGGSRSFDDHQMELEEQHGAGCPPLLHREELFVQNRESNGILSRREGVVWTPSTVWCSQCFPGFPQNAMPKSLLGWRWCAPVSNGNQAGALGALSGHGEQLLAGLGGVSGHKGWGVQPGATLGCDGC